MGAAEVGEVLGRGHPLPDGAAAASSSGCSVGAEPFFAGAWTGCGEPLDSGSGADRIAAISGRTPGRGPGAGPHAPAISFARIAAVIHSRSSTRLSSASATRSSDWL